MTGTNDFGIQFAQKRADRKRSFFDFKYRCSLDEVRRYTEIILTTHGFRLKNIDGAAIWEKGNGIFTTAEFIKTDIDSGHLRIYAWVEYAFIANFGTMPMNLEGFNSILQKKHAKKTIEEIRKKVM